MSEPSQNAACGTAQPASAGQFVMEPGSLHRGRAPLLREVADCARDGPVLGECVHLADEPTGALDSAGGEEIIELLRRLHAGGQTIVMVTHDARVAAAAGRLVRMRDGRIEHPEAQVGNGGPIVMEVR